jgi:hypothetical protein
MTPKPRLEVLKKFVLENLPNDRVRHALLEIVVVLQEQKQESIMLETHRKKGIRNGPNEKNLS